MTKRVLTAESVTSGHPDKLADLIADSILDECLRQDPESRVACEVMLSYNKCFISGEITTAATVDYCGVAKRVIQSIGYSTDGIEFESRIHGQSGDIAAAVDGATQGAGDQGIVYGYATDETLNYIPLPLELAHRLTNRLEECRIKNLIEGLMPDGKSQVSIEYINDRFSKITSVILSAQHKPDKGIEVLKSQLRVMVIDKVFEEYDLSDTKILINPSGRFVKGGFEADTGLTGRKLMVDTYGGIARNGGGALCGKDASKVDKSGAYLARYIAKNIVAADLAEKCEVTLSYAIGVSMPTTIDIQTFYTAVISEQLILNAVKKVFDLSVGGAIDTLMLKCPLYSITAVGGHFGRENLPWENMDKIKELKDAVMPK
jgi:S-adenosylmethionine synthetase